MTNKKNSRQHCTAKKLISSRQKNNMACLRSQNTPTPHPIRKNSTQHQHIPLVEVDVSLLADHGGETTSNTSDLGQGENNLVASINVGVEDTKDVVKLLLVDDKSLWKRNEPNGSISIMNTHKQRKDTSTRE